MKQKASFSEKQSEYKYEKLKNGKVHIFIREFIEEVKEINEDGIKNSVFVYNQNEFDVNENEITEDMIKEKPLSYIDYNPKDEEVSLTDRINAIEDAICEIGEMMYND